jgi:hypothetical protein
MFGPDYRTPKYEGEERVSAVQHGPIVELLRSGADVIVDDTNLRVRNVKTFLQLAARAGADARVVDDFLDVDVEECVRRDAARPNPVGERVIWGMWEKYLSGGRRLHVPVLDEAVAGLPYIPAPGTAHAVLVDIDGTVLRRSVGWELHMRPAGDVRNDAIVKLELFDQHVRDRYRVAYVLDDRDRVVRAWRSIGLTVLQVADGDF